MPETLEALSQAIEEHRSRRPVKPAPFDPHSPEGVAFLAHLQGWAKDLDELQARFVGLSNRMTFSRLQPAARAFNSHPLRLRQ